jgi:hypothetical protein
MTYRNHPIIFVTAILLLTIFSMGMIYFWLHEEE